MGKILLLQFFWVSFVLIGLTLLFWCSRKFPSVKQSYFLQFLRQTHPLVALLVAFALGVASFLPFIVPAYIFELSLWFVALPYLALLLVTIYTVVYCRRIWVKTLRQIPKINRRQLLILVLVGTALVCDFELSMKVKGILGGDSQLHIARVNYLLTHGHFALADPFFGNNGVVDPRYSTNLLLGLMAIAGKLFHLSALDIWYYSYAIFRLVTWLSLFALAWNFLDKKVRNQWSYIILALSPFVYNVYFRYAEFPDRIVLVWTALFIIGLKLWLEKGSWPLLLLACGLIATTHSLNALMAFGFLSLMGLVLAVHKSLTRKRVLVLGGALLILLPTILQNLYYPNLTDKSEIAFHANVISGTNMVVQHLGPLQFAKPNTPSLTTLVLLGFMAACVYFGGKIKQPKYRIIIFFLTLVIAFLTYNPVYSIVSGYAYLLYTQRSAKTRMILVLLIIYYGLMAYNPIFMHFAVGKLPPWFIDRFQEFNVISLLIPLLGWLVVIETPKLLWGYKRVTTVLYAVVPVVYIFALPVFYSGLSRPTSPLDLRTKDYYARHAITNTLQDLKPELDNQVVYSSNLFNVFMVPSVASHASIVTMIETNYPPMTSIPIRKNCGRVLDKDLRLADLQAAGVTRLLINTRLEPDMLKLAESRPYLYFAKETNSVRVYRVLPAAYDQKSVSSSACNIPYKQ